MILAGGGTCTQEDDGVFFAFVRSLFVVVFATGAFGLALAFAASGTGDPGAAQNSVLLTTCLGSFKRIGRAAGKLRAPPLSIIC